MKQTKLVQVLDTFSEKEKKELDILLQSDLIPLSKDGHKLFNCLQRQTSSNAPRQKSIIYAQIYPSTPYNDQKLRLLSSQLLKACEQYIVIAQLDSVDHVQYKNLVLAKYFRDKGLTKNYSSHYNQIQKTHAKSNFGLSPRNLLDIEFEHYQFESLQQRSKSFNLNALLDLADQSYFAEKLKYACYAVANKNVNATSEEIEMDVLIEKITHLNAHLNPHIGVYFHCYFMLKNHEDDSHYLQFIDTLTTNELLFSVDEKRSLYFFALNYCIRKLNEGNRDFGVKGLDIYETLIDSALIFNQGKLSRFTYRNMAMMAIRVGDYTRAESLTIRFEPSLQASERTSAFHFNMALIYYHKKDLQSALSSITQADFSDHLIGLAAKTLQAKIYYEMDEDKVLDSHLDSMGMYIIRSKVLGYHKTNYKNFIRHLKRLIKLNMYDVDRKKKYTTTIKAESILTERAWFLEMVA